jgi:hypothetical protein
MNTQNQNSQSTASIKISSTANWIISIAIVIVKTMLVITIFAILCNLFLPQILDFNIFGFKPLEGLKYDPRYPSLILK